jgi:hypothetical protein
MRKEAKFGFEKLTVTQLVKKLPAYNEKRILTTAFHRADLQFSFRATSIPHHHILY